MDISNRTKIFNIVFSLIFLGVILSFSLYFSMTSVMRPEENISDGYLDSGSELSDTDVYSYDNACLKNKFFHTMIVETEYRLFGNIKQGGVVRGKHDFLFDVGQNSKGYSYITDYVGGYTLTEAELENFYDVVTTRCKVYENQGRYYVFAVIPNSQTVYDEYMPSYFGGMSQRTMLSQISAYMSERGVDCFLDLTDALLGAKDNGVLYNNTENSINALGAYFVYEGVMNGIPQRAMNEPRTLSLTDFEYFTHYTDGKSSAVAVGLESLIKNETVSMSNSTEFKYTVVNYTGDYETTYVKSTFTDRVPLNPYVLVECSNEWDKIQLMPYFSNTFGVSSYKVGHGYDKEIVARSNPLIVIQTIREDELIELLGMKDSGYSSALTDSAVPYKTGMPSRVEYTILDDRSICITGKIESDAEVQVFGDGFEPIYAKGIGGMFFVKVTFEDQAEGREVILNAKAPDKAASDLLTLSISGQNNVGSARDVLIGSNSMLYSADYGVAYVLPPKDQLDDFEYKLYNLFSCYTQSNDTLDTKIIFGLLPRKLSVYTEGMPRELNAQLEMLNETKSTIGGMMHKVGARYVDFAAVLREKASNGKIFNQTDDLLTDLAYYNMYREVVSIIAQRHSNVKPIRSDGFLEYSVPLSGGGLASSLGFDMSRVTEVVTKFRFSISKPHFHNGDGSYVCYSADPTLPTAVIVYDELSEPMVELLTQHFSATYVMRKGDTNITDKILSSMRPDYIIYLCDEGNINFEIKY